MYTCSDELRENRVRWQSKGKQGTKLSEEWKLIWLELLQDGSEALQVQYEFIDLKWEQAAYFWGFSSHVHLFACRSGVGKVKFNQCIGMLKLP